VRLPLAALHSLKIKLDFFWILTSDVFQDTGKKVKKKSQKLNPKKLPKPSLFFATIIQKSKVSVLGDPKKTQIAC
jgi:hypothetical protein